MRRKTQPGPGRRGTPSTGGTRHQQSSPGKERNDETHGTGGNCTADFGGRTSGDACTLGSDVLQEVPNPGVTHIKGMYGMEDVSWATFYTSGTIRSGVYRVDNPDEENGYIEVSNGVWVEAGYGCHSTYSYDVFVWNGHGGSLCSEDDFNYQTRDCN